MAVTSFASQPCYARPAYSCDINNKKTIYLKLDKDKSKPLSIAEFEFDFSQIIGHIGDCTNGPYPSDAMLSSTFRRIKYDGKPKAKKIKISTQAENKILTIGSKPRFKYIKGDPFCSYEMAYTENGKPFNDEGSPCFSRACLKFLRKRYVGRTVRFRVSDSDFYSGQYSENVYTVKGKRVYPNRAQSMEGRYNGHRMKHKMVHHKAFSFPACNPDPIKARKALSDKYGLSIYCPDRPSEYNDYDTTMIFGASLKFGKQL